MKYLVDTSVWSLFFRKKGPADHPSVRSLSALLAGSEEVLITGLILQEVLQAFREDKTFHRMAQHLESISLLELDRSIYVAAARLHRQCAARGFAVSTADCQIAAAALEHGCTLVTADADFTRLAKIAPLKVMS